MPPVPIQNSQPNILAQSQETLYAIYDYAVAPVTFDFLEFVKTAEMWRAHKGFKRINFLLTLNFDTSFRQRTEKDAAMSHAEKMWRIRQIHIPACWLLESCGSVSFFSERFEFYRHLAGLKKDNIFEPGYHPDKPLVLFNPGNVQYVFKAVKRTPLVFQATEAALANVDRWRATRGLAGDGIGRGLVAITLRGSALESERNANWDDWRRFMALIESEGYKPILVPDTDQVFDTPDDKPLADVPIFWPGPVNLELRAALYARCHICMSDNGAAAFIHQFMPNSNSVVFQSPTKIPRSVQNPEVHAQVQGIKRGEQYPFFTDTQWFAWSEDTFDEIVSNFRILEAKIAAKGG